MANLTLINTAAAAGSYLGEATTIETAVDAEILIIEDIEITMTAAKIRWSDFRPNTYTITITNNDPTNAFELNDTSVILVTTDAFDTSVVTVNESSVNVTGNVAGQITVTDGVLSVELTESIGAGMSTSITFDVNRIEP